jgi:uncharacterized protein (TIGR02996 family)
VSERAAFISAILDNLADDTPRLVFADWLQEHGEEERAEFIRAQINPASLPESVREKSDPRARIAGKHGAALGGGWRRAIGVSETEGEYVRGFLTGVEVHSTHFLLVAGRALALEPVEFELQLCVRHADDEPVMAEEIEDLADNPHLRAVTRIAATSPRQHDYSPEYFAVLMKSPHLTNVRGIAISEPALGVTGVEAIARAPAAFALRLLDLSESLPVDQDAQRAAIECLATHPRFTALKFLSLRFNALDNDAIEILLASRTLPRALKLDVAGNGFSQRRFARALAKRFTGGSGD